MSAFRVNAPVSAPFFRERKPKIRKPSGDQKREKEAPGYLVKVRRLPCCVCGDAAPSHAHHLKSAEQRGMGQKVANRWTVPLCNECHLYGVEKVGSRQEASWFRKRGILCMDLAAALYANAHSMEAMLNVLATHKERRS